MDAHSQVHSLRLRCLDLNDRVEVEAIPVRLRREDWDFAETLVRAFDLVVDATDNPTTRYFLGFPIHP